MFRDVDTLEVWIQICRKHDKSLDGQEAFAAIRKLHELIRAPPHGASNGAAFMTDLSATVAGVLDSCTENAAALSPSQQQILINELAHLGHIFTSNAWREFCPAVPLDLLNNTLDMLLDQAHTLRGDQVGVLLASLQKLQLRDAKAYTRLVDTAQTALADREASYLRVDSIARLISGFCKVYVGIPNGLTDWQARSTIGMLATELCEVPDAELAGDASRWQLATGILGTISNLPPAVAAPCAPFCARMATLITERRPKLDGRVLAWTLPVFAVGPFRDSGVTTLLLDELRIRLSELGSHAAADTADAIACLPDAPRDILEDMVEYVLKNRKGAAEDGPRIMRAAARAGVLSEAQWHRCCDAFGAYVLAAAPQFSTLTERNTHAFVEAMIARGEPEETVVDVATAAAGWIRSGALRLWRLAPWMQTMAPAVRSYPAATDIVLSAAVQQLPAEADPLSVMCRRGVLVADAVAACIRAGRPADTSALLANFVITGALAEQGSVALGILTVIAQLADVLPEERNPGTQEALGCAWEAVSSGDGKIEVGALRSMGTAEECARVARALVLHLPDLRWLPSYGALMVTHLPEGGDGDADVTGALAAALADAEAGRRVEAADRIATAVAAAYTSYAPTRHQELSDEAFERMALKGSFAKGQGSSEGLAERRGTEQPRPQPAAAAPPAPPTVDAAHDAAMLSNINPDIDDIIGAVIEPFPQPLMELAEPARASGAQAPLQEEAKGPEQEGGDLLQLTVPELKARLKALGLKVSGKKAELVQRLEEGLEAEVGMGEGIAGVEEERTAPEEEEGMEEMAGVVAMERAVEEASAVGSGGSMEREAGVEMEAVGGTAEGSAGSRDLESMTVAELKELLKGAGLRVSGRKSELIERCLANGV